MATAAPQQQKQQLQTRKPTHRTLGALLKYFVDMPLRVELKSGRMYSGTLSSAEVNMSLTLTDVVQVSPPPSREPQTTLATNSLAAPPVNEAKVLSLVQIRGSTIRYIHFPDHVDLATVVKAGIQREKEARDKYKRGVRKGRKETPLSGST